MDRITKIDNLEMPSNPKIWKKIWKNELDQATYSGKNPVLFAPTYTEIARKSKKKPSSIKRKTGGKK